MKRRKEATAEILRLIDKLLPGSENAKLYEERLGKLTDAQFDAYMQSLKSGEQILTLIAPNISEFKLDLERNLAIAKELDHNFFQRLWLTDAASGTLYLTPKRYLCVDLVLRRQQQSLQKKIKIPVDSRHIDELTGQPRDASKGSSLTYPEVQVMNSQGQDNTLLELMKYRGGDEKGRYVFERSVFQTGGVSMAGVKQTVTSRPKSTETLSTLLKGMHLDNNI